MKVCATLTSDSSVARQYQVGNWQFDVPSSCFRLCCFHHSTVQHTCVTLNLRVIQISWSAWSSTTYMPRDLPATIGINVFSPFSCDLEYRSKRRYFQKNCLLWDLGRQRHKLLSIPFESPGSMILGWRAWSSSVGIALGYGFRVLVNGAPSSALRFGPMMIRRRLSFSFLWNVSPQVFRT